MSATTAMLTNTTRVPDPVARRLEGDQGPDTRTTLVNFRLITRRGSLVRVGVDDAAGAVFVSEGRIFRIVRILRLLFGIQMVEIAEELVEAVIGGQELVTIAKTVLAELPGSVAQRLEQFGERGILGLKSDRITRHADLQKPRTLGALSGDEGRSAGGAALLAVGIGEQHALLGDPIDVRRLIPHHAVVLGAGVEPADVVAEDHQDVGHVGGHGERQVERQRQGAEPGWPESSVHHSYPVWWIGLRLLRMSVLDG
jgi:hypothetical protein